jgi:PAS domain S-box-containing protein
MASRKNGKTSRRSGHLTPAIMVRRLELLCRLAGEVAALREEPRTLRHVVQTAVKVVGVPAAHVALVDRTRRSLYGLVSSGSHPPRAPRARFDLSPGQAALTALRSRRPVVIRDARADRRVHTEARERLRLGSVAYLPLLAGKESFGLLILSRPRPHSWSPEEIRLAKHVACFASVALQTSRLLDQLAETDGRFRSLIQDIPAVVYTCEVDFPYRTFSVGRQIEAILGTPASQWLEDPELFFKLIHPDDLPGVLAANEEGKAGRGFVRTEYRLLDRKGSTRWFRDEAVLVRDPAGAPVAWHGVLVEITGIKELGATLGRPDAPPPPGDLPRLDT